MINFKNLNKLIEAVKAGEWNAAGDGNDTWLLIFDAGFQSYHGYIYEAWCRKSLNAFLALKEALLPETFYSIDSQDQIVCVFSADMAIVGVAHHKTPARAGLLAVLEAYRAKLEAEQ